MKKEFGGHLLKFLFFLGCIIGLTIVSIWSYRQTQLFFAPFDGTSGTTTISNSMALIFQYGQNVALFLVAIEAGRRLAYQNKKENERNPSHIAILDEEVNKSHIKSIVYYVLFGIFALVDAGTNIGQFFNGTIQTYVSSYTGNVSTLFYIVGGTACLAIVFIEEVAIDNLNALFHAFNDVLESVGVRRIESFDLFVDPNKLIATRLTEKLGANYKSNTMGFSQSTYADKPKTKDYGRKDTKSLISKRVTGRDLRPAVPLRNLNRPEEDDEDEIPSFLKSQHR